MDRDLETALFQERAGLRENGLFYPDDRVQSSPVALCRSAERCGRERDRIFRPLTSLAAHADELPETGSFLTPDVGGLAMLPAPASERTVNAILNACRRRGPALSKRRRAASTVSAVLATRGHGQHGGTVRHSK